MKNDHQSVIATSTRSADRECNCLASSPDISYLPKGQRIMRFAKQFVAENQKSEKMWVFPAFPVKHVVPPQTFCHNYKLYQE
jgi:hypothetical protein